MIQIDKKNFEIRKEKLEQCRKFLKQEFIGIDNIIDELLDYIQIWYLLPEILTRPIIINLWGMTGVGKTDMIRKMVKSLDFQDRFVEIELSNSDETSWNKNVADTLQKNRFNDGNPAIVLFDEIQRFNTLDSEGNPVPQTKFTDFWELLSDGRLSKKERDDIDHYLYSYLFRKKENQRRIKKGEESYDENPFLNMWDAKELRNYLGLQNDVMELSEMTEDDMIKMILKSKKEKKIYEPVDYSKMLIIISGNLDDAFQMAGQTSEADVDADIFHAFTNKITLVDIKNALTKKFRPEQVARFGNIHLIYNSLRKQDFEKIISKEISKIKKQTKSKLGISLQIGKKINELIYRNGVFPVQGVRPVFSSVVDILESNLSKLIFEAVVKNQDSISIDYDEKTENIIAHIGKDEYKMPYVGRIDKIRQNTVLDSVANISVHEAGHAAVYMYLMKLVPLQLKSRIASSYAAGFTFPHQIHETKQNLLNKIKIYLAGGIAEELIFGENLASVGRSHDREMATTFAAEYIRHYGFDENHQATYNLEAYPYRMQQHITDEIIEKLMKKLVQETKDILTENIEFLKELSISLCIKGSLDGKEMAEISKKHHLNVLMKEEGFLKIDEYKKLLDSQ